jgi:uncharacterized protein (DUF2141 family)
MSFKKMFAFSIFFFLTTSLMATYDRSTYFGVLKKDSQGNEIILEHPSRISDKGPTAIVRVQNIKNTKGRVRVAVWSDKKIFTSEEVAPNRASSYPAKVGEMVFEITGLEKGKGYSFFAHHDENNNGKVDRNFLRIPTEPYMFTDKKNQGKGPGLKRHSNLVQAPSFEDTLVTIISDRQEVQITF